jgi:hypothetical protein
MLMPNMMKKMKAKMIGYIWVEAGSIESMCETDSIKTYSSSM